MQYFDMKSASKDSYPFPFRAGFLGSEIGLEKVQNFECTVRDFYTDLDQFLWIVCNMISKVIYTQVS